MQELDDMLYVSESIWMVNLPSEFVNFRKSIRELDGRFQGLCRGEAAV